MNKEKEKLDIQYLMFRNNLISEEELDEAEFRYKFFKEQYEIWRRQSIRFFPSTLHEMFPEVAPKPKETKGTITDDMKVTARLYPIDSFMEFNNQSKALCLWHNEKTPSLVYNRLGRYANTVKCYSCGVLHDSISTYQQITGATFKEAVRVLSRL